MTTRGDEEEEKNDCEDSKAKLLAQRRLNSSVLSTRFFLHFSTWALFLLLLAG